MSFKTKDNEIIKLLTGRLTFLQLFTVDTSQICTKTVLHEDILQEGSLLHGGSFLHESKKKQKKKDTDRGLLVIIKIII